MENDIRDFPKLQSPFIRKTINKNYIVTPEIDPDYQWVFEDGVRAVDKLDGTNICIEIKDGNIHRIFNRKNEKFIFSIEKQTKFEGAILEGVASAIKRDWLRKHENKYIFGELIGETIGSGRPPYDITNRHQVKGHLFVPFEYLQSKCYWRSWQKNQYPKNYETIRQWFKDGIPSLFNQRLKFPEIKAEGLVFYHHDGRMAKIRLDQFDFYKGKRHKENIDKV